MESKYYEMIIQFLEHGLEENTNEAEIQKTRNKIQMVSILIRHFRFIENVTNPTAETKAEYDRLIAVAEDILAA